MVDVGGGYPLLEDGKLIGGIGISGGAYQQDQDACAEALMKIAFQLPANYALPIAGDGPPFNGHDVTFLAAYGAMELLKGPPVDGAVILRFPSVQVARDW